MAIQEHLLNRPVGLEKAGANHYDKMPGIPAEQPRLRQSLEKNPEQILMQIPLMRSTTRP
jgi:hypothetical protein